MQKLGLFLFIIFSGLMFAERCVSAAEARHPAEKVLQTLKRNLDTYKLSIPTPGKFVELSEGFLRQTSSLLKSGDRSMILNYVFHADQNSIDFDRLGYALAAALSTMTGSDSQLGQADRRSARNGLLLMLKFILRSGPSESRQIPALMALRGLATDVYEIERELSMIKDSNRWRQGYLLAETVGVVTGLVSILCSRGSTEPGYQGDEVKIVEEAVDVLYALQFGFMQTIIEGRLTDTSALNLRRELMAVIDAELTSMRFSKLPHSAFVKMAEHNIALLHIRCAASLARVSGKN
jgi:hypothetical protein